jgi:hypothetical protein
VRSETAVVVPAGEGPVAQVELAVEAASSSGDPTAMAKVGETVAAETEKKVVEALATEWSTS